MSQGYPQGLPGSYTIPGVGPGQPAPSPYPGYAPPAGGGYPSGGYPSGGFTPGPQPGIPPVMSGPPMGTPLAGGIPPYLGDPFAAIVGASVSGNGNYLRDGDYLLVVKKITFRKSNKSEGQVIYAEMTVLDSRPKSVDEWQLGGKCVVVGTLNAVRVIPQAPGEPASMSAKLEKKMGAVNAKAFLMALVGIDERQFDADEAKSAAVRAQVQAAGVMQHQWPKEAFSPFSSTIAWLINNDPGRGPVQPARGTIIRASTFRKENEGKDVEANKGKILCLAQYIHVPPNPELTAKRRALLDLDQFPGLPGDKLDAGGAIVPPAVVQPPSGAVPGTVQPGPGGFAPAGASGGMIYVGMPGAALPGMPG